jgi:hypothetical protein
MRGGEISKSLYSNWKDGAKTTMQKYYLKKRVGDKKVPEEYLTFKQIMVLDKLKDGKDYMTSNFYFSDFKISNVTLTKHIKDLDKKGLIDLKMVRVKNDAFQFKINSKGLKVLAEWKKVYYE